MTRDFPQPITIGPLALQQLAAVAQLDPIDEACRDIESACIDLTIAAQHMMTVSGALRIRQLVSLLRDELNAVEALALARADALCG